MMTGISSIGGSPDLQQMMQRRLGGAMPEGMEELRGGMQSAAKNVRNEDGQSLYEMKDQILATVKDSIGDDAAGPERFRNAMDQALRDNGFDPEALKSELRPMSVGGFQGRSGLPGGQGGGFPALAGGGGLSPGGLDPSSLFGADPEASADALIQDLLSRLPAGSSVYEEA